MARATCGTDGGYYRHRREGTAPCEPCTTAHAAAEADRQRRATLGMSRPPGRPPGYYRPDTFGQLAVACWCDTDVVHIPAAQVGVTTASCGRPGCREPLAA